MATRCANPDCPDRAFALRSNHWVQIEEVKLVGQHQGEGPVQRLFAAVACSKRCAVAVLAAELPAEEAAETAERQKISDMFPGVRAT